MKALVGGFNQEKAVVDAFSVIDCEIFANLGSKLYSLQISLHVLYAPQVRAVRRLVEGGAGQRAVLECMVAARPRPEVRCRTW